MKAVGMMKVTEVFELLHVLMVDGLNMKARQLAELKSMKTPRSETGRR